MRFCPEISNRDTMMVEENKYDLDIMYGEGNWEDKIKLFLHLALFEKYDHKEVRMNVEIKTKDGKELELPKCKIHHPYPNKNYNCFGMIKNRRLTKNGCIPLLFNSYEELSNIENITFKCDVVFNEEDVEYCIISHDMEFNTPKSNTQLTYCVKDRVMCVSTFNDVVKDNNSTVFKNFESDFDCISIFDNTIKYTQKLTLDSFTGAEVLF